MKCTGSPRCGNTKCYHFKEHERYPDGDRYDYCGGSCFNGAACLPVEVQITPENSYEDKLVAARRKYDEAEARFQTIFKVIMSDKPVCPACRNPLEPDVALEHVTGYICYKCQTKVFVMPLNPKPNINLPCSKEGGD